MGNIKVVINQDNVITWKCFPHHFLFVREIYQMAIDSHHKGTVMANCSIHKSLAWTSCWTNQLSPLYCCIAYQRLVCYATRWTWGTTAIKPLETYMNKTACGTWWGCHVIGSFSLMGKGRIFLRLFMTWWSAVSLYTTCLISSCHVRSLPPPRCSHSVCRQSQEKRLVSYPQQEALRERKPPPRLVWRVWNSLLKRETV